MSGGNRRRISSLREPRKSSRRPQDSQETRIWRRREAHQEEPQIRKRRDSALEKQGPIEKTGATANEGSCEAELNWTSLLRDGCSVDGKAASRRRTPKRAEYREGGRYAVRQEKPQIRKRRDSALQNQNRRRQKGRWKKSAPTCWKLEVGYWRLEQPCRPEGRRYEAKARKGRHFVKGANGT